MGTALAVAALALGAPGCSDEAPPQDPSAFCEGIERLRSLVVAAEAGPENIDDVPAARSLADDLAAVANEAGAAAPDEIAAEARTLARVTAELARELADFYGAIEEDPTRANDPAFLSAFDPVTAERTEAIVAAGDDVRPWIEEHC